MPSSPVFIRRLALSLLPLLLAGHWDPPLWAQVTPAAVSAQAPEAQETTGQQEKRRSKRVLLLYTHRLVSPVNAEWYRGIKAELNAAFNEPLDIEVEYLDLLRNNDEVVEQKWRDLLRCKYARKKPDVVIPIYIGAINFLLTHRDEVFPEVPIVFCSATRNISEQARKLPGVTGTTFEIDFNGTRELIRQLQPDVSKLVIITGAARENLDLRSALGVGLLFSVYFSQTFEIDVWDGLPLAEMEARISRLQPDTAVLMLTYDFDKLGNQYVTVDAAEQLSQKSSVPVYGVFDSLIGRGVLGGSMASVETQGRLAGRLAVEILLGKRPEDLPPREPGPPVLLLDDRQLRRYGIAMNRIPQRAEVRYQVPVNWREFGRYLLIGGAALILQSAIIISLLVNRRRRIAAEQEAQTLAGKILTAQEEERSHLARELHDDLSQRLAAVAIEAGQLEHQTEGQGSLVANLSKLRQGVISICDDLHRLSRRMHPSILDDFGLADALCADCTGLMQRTDIEVDCQIGDLPDRIPKPVELCLYRIAQESLWNAVKHSGATRISAKLAAEAGNVRLEIADNGRGLGTAARPPSKGLGLASIKERIRLVSGTVEIESESGKGTRIIAQVPLRRHES